MKPKLLISNVFFSPRSFGGATIVAEELAIHLAHTWDILVITTLQNDDLIPYSSIRYQSKNINIVGINIPSNISRIEQYKNLHFAKEFSKWLISFKPDISHFHCIQNMGAELITACKEKKIPTVVTIHDNWWICERQFMVDRHGNYCDQTKINIKKCIRCTLKIDGWPYLYSEVKSRFNYLKNKLKDVDIILFPSEHQRKLYKENQAGDISSYMINKNGVTPPSNNYQKIKIKEKTRFGFVGGFGKNKGYFLIEEAFHLLKNAQYELYLVDNTLNLGFSTMIVDENLFSGEVKIIPAYTQETIDNFFENIDVLLFPSQLKESFGLTVREALLRDVWVIATDCGGPIEDIKNGINGDIIPFNSSPTYLANILTNIIEKDLSNYKNKEKSNILNYKRQAQELDGILRNLLK